MSDIKDDCNLTVWDPEKVIECTGGSKWSVVWTLNAITVLGLAVSNLLMMVGAY